MDNYPDWRDSDASRDWLEKRFIANDPILGSPLLQYARYMRGRDAINELLSRREQLRISAEFPDVGWRGSSDDTEALYPDRGLRLPRWAGPAYNDIDGTRQWLEGWYAPLCQTLGSPYLQYVLALVDRNRAAGRPLDPGPLIRRHLNFPEQGRLLPCIDFR